MTHDRVQSDRLELNQEFLSTMLGVERSGVTIAAITLQEAELIKYSRGKITVIDRRGLERASCECYGRVQTIFDVLLKA
jgi:Mn-dependent DtxR family transcriptional regulator